MSNKDAHDDRLSETGQARLNQAAERICAHAFGGSLRLGEPRPTRDWDGRSRTRRFEILEGPSGAPASVVAKEFLLGEGHGYDEWAGLRLLTESGEAALPTPRLYGGDAEMDLIVMEDLGDARRHGLSALLRGTDPNAAAEMLGEWMAAIARLHAIGSGRESDYRRLRDSFPERRNEAFHTVHRLEEMVHGFGENGACVGLQLSERAEADLRSVLIDLRQPGPFTGLSHGDVCPSNAIRQGQRVRLFDLEVCGYRHLLLDGVYPQLRYLCCQEAGRIPHEVQRKIGEVYRKELSKHCPPAADDGLYGRGLVVAGAAWLSALVARIPSVLERDRKRMLGTDRQRILQGLQDFGALTSAYGHLPALGDAALALRNCLKVRWPGEEHRLALLPAFQTSSV